MMNPSLAPRRRNCIICKSVTDLADVNLRLFDAEGNRHVHGVRDTLEYLRGIGMTGNDSTVKSRIRKHSQHTEQYVRTHDAPPPVTPGLQGTVTRIGEQPEATWLSVQQAVMNLGHEALGILETRLPEMEDKELVSTVRMGLSAANKRADLEIKGHVRRSAERMRVASGLANDG